jgi:type I restriction enzyme, S subunit
VFVRSLIDTDENHNVIPEDLSNYKVARAGNLVINKMKAWQGSMGISPTDGIVSPAYYVFDFDIADHAFGQALLRSKPYVAHFGQASDGVRVAQWDLTISGMREIPVLEPPPEEQAAIVRFLDWANHKLERAIRAKRKVITLLNEQKQAIIHRDVTRGFDPAVPLKPSGIPSLGDIPQHWEVRRLKHISPKIGVGLVINPSSYFVDETHPARVPMLLGNNIIPNGFRLEKVRHIGANDNRRLSASRLTGGDVVVVRVGAPGVAAVIPPSLDGCNCASVMIVRKHTSFVSQWLAHVFNSPIVTSQIDAVKYGAAQKQFNISHAVDFLFPVPPNVEQQEIVDGISEHTAPLDRTVRVAEREIELLREYRTRLSADVVTGKLDVRDAIAKLPEEKVSDTVENDTDLSIDPEAGDEEAVA